jgi:DNA-binding NarL/FixJ family response regulator
VHAEQPELPILVLSALNGAANVSRLLRAGASGYITSENRPDDLRVAVRQVASGERFIDPLLVDAIFFGTPADNGSQVGPLSNRENQVLGLIASGRSLSDIARSLALSVKTISTHKTRMMQKLNVGNNAELIRYAIRQGLVAE